MRLGIVKSAHSANLGFGDAVSDFGPRASDRQPAGWPIQVAKTFQQTHQMIPLAPVPFARRRVRSVRTCAWLASLTLHGPTSFTPMKQSANKQNAAGPNAC